MVTIDIDDIAALTSILWTLHTIIAEFSDQYIIVHKNAIKGFGKITKHAYSTLRVFICIKYICFLQLNTSVACWATPSENHVRVNTWLFIILKPILIKTQNEGQKCTIHCEPWKGYDPTGVNYMPYRFLLNTGCCCF